ncbi:UNVERIFIED_CONTAM: hypothetical protein FKN15_032126 [Acipenser sinensis]
MAEDQENAYGLYRPQIYLFGCALKPEKKEYKFDVVDEEAEHQLCLKSICLGAEAADEFHTVEIEGLNYEGTMIKVQLAVLKPSVIPTICLGAEAADEFHTVEIEGLNYEGTMIKVQLAVLKPSVIPTVST